MQQNNNDNSAPKQDAFPPANIGNASNPTPDEGAGEGVQLIDKKGEKYLREVASPEDYPDEQDWEEANKIIEKEKAGSEDNNQ